MWWSLTPGGQSQQVGFKKSHLRQNREVFVFRVDFFYLPLTINSGEDFICFENYII